MDQRTGALRRGMVAAALALGLLVIVLWLATPARASVAEATAVVAGEKRADPAVVRPGGVVTYSLVLSNSSEISSVSVLVTDPLHALLSYVPGSGVSDPAESGTLEVDGGITWTLTLSPSGMVTLTYQAEVDAAAADGTVISNTATISGGGEVTTRAAGVRVDGEPTSQIWEPERDGVVTEGERLRISGYAWDAGAEPPFITEDAELSVQRLGERTYYVGWTEVVSAEQYILQEAEVADFSVYSETLVAAPTTNLLVSKGVGEDGTYYYRVQAVRFGLEPSRWSNVEAVTVPWVLGTVRLDNAGLEGRLSRSEVVAVEVRIDEGAWQTATLTATTWAGGWAWTYDWEPLPAERETVHVIQSRAIDGTGIPGPVDVLDVVIDNTRYFVFLPLMIRNWPPVPYAPVLNAIDNGDQDGDYFVSWTYDPGTPPITADNYTLQQDTGSDFSSPTVYTTTATSRAFVGQVPGGFYYRVRGNNVHGHGPWSNVASTVVLPGVPTLNAIDNPSKSSAYTVSWTPVAGAEAYALEEATNADFTGAAVVYSGPDVSYQITSKSSGTYYYRVRSVHGALSSPWSNVVSTVVEAADYYDSFSDPSTGWTTHSAQSGLEGCDFAREHLDYKYNLYYENGRYKVYVPLDCRAGGDHGDTRHIYPLTFPPGVKRPSARTCVAMGGSFEDWDPYWSFYGLVFAASDDMKTVYSLEANNLGDWAIIKRQDYQYPGPNHPYLNESRTSVKPDTGYVGGQRYPGKTAYERNDLKVEIGTSELIFFLNGLKIYELNDPYIVNEVRALRNVGIIGGNWEITPTRIGYDYFYMDVGCDNY